MASLFSPTPTYILKYSHLLSLPSSHSAVTLVGQGMPGQPAMELQSFRGVGETEYHLYSETKT